MYYWLEDLVQEYQRNRKEYQAGYGTPVSGDDGMEHIIEHAGVASHPGDVGMEVIAQRVLEMIKD